MGLILDRVALGVILLLVLRLPPVSIITPMLRTRLCRNTSFTKVQTDEAWGTSNKAAHCTESTVLLYFSTLTGYFESWKAHMERFVASDGNSFEWVKCRGSDSLIK